SYPLGYGDRKRTKTHYWHHSEFDLIHQTHDGKHTYISTLEVAVKADEISLPIKSLHSDLHRVYLLAGKATIRPTKDTKSRPLTLQGNQYALLYTPAQQSGRLALGKGWHLLVGIAVERQWQKRQPING